MAHPRLSSLVFVSLFAMACTDHPRLFGSGDLWRFPERYGYSGTYSIGRNALGTELHFFEIHGNGLIVLSKTGEVIQLTRPNVGSFLNENGDFVNFPSLDEYFREEAELLATPPYGQDGVESSGKYFFVVPKRDVTLVGAIGDPERPIGTFELSANGIFYRNDRIYLCGMWAGRRLDVTCVIIAFEGGEFKQERSFVIPGCKYVKDVDPYSDEMLVVTHGDLFSLWYLFNERTKTMRFAGGVKRFGFFLHEDLISVLRN